MIFRCKLTFIVGEIKVFYSVNFKELEVLGMRQTWRRYFGPSTMVTAAFIGPGTVTMCTIVGVRTGSALLWALVFFSGGHGGSARNVRSTWRGNPPWYG